MSDVKLILGDCIEIMRGMEAESVDLIFADPIYSEKDTYLALAEVSLRILKPSGLLLCWSNGKWHRLNTNWLENAGMIYRWDFACVHNSGLSPMNGKIIAKTNRLIWLDKNNKSKMIGYLPDGFLSTPWLSNREIEKHPEHRWTKSPKFTRLALRAFLDRNGVLLDPFMGGGTVPVCAVQLGYEHIIGCEMNEKIFKSACKRIEAATMEPQLSMIDSLPQFKQVGLI